MQVASADLPSNSWDYNNEYDIIKGAIDYWNNYEQNTGILHYQEHSTRSKVHNVHAIAHLVTQTSR